MYLDLPSPEAFAEHVGQRKAFIILDDRPSPGDPDQVLVDVILTTRMLPPGEPPYIARLKLPIAHYKPEFCVGRGFAQGDIDAFVRRLQGLGL